MTKFTNSLNNIKIASPCSADWDEMAGSERRRSCGDCNLNVYNLSGMSKREAEVFLMNSEGRVCVRFFKRADGTILTRDCSVGWQAIKQRVSKSATAFASLILACLAGIGSANLFTQSNDRQTTKTIPVIENPTVDVTAVDELKPNVSAQNESILPFENVSGEQFRMGLWLVEPTKTKRQFRKKRNR